MKKLLYLFLFTALIGFNSCSDSEDDVKLPDITVNFTSAELGLDEDNESIDITINLSRKAESAIDVTLGVTATGAVYGTQFTTSPAVANNQLVVNIPAGSTSVSFKVSKVSEALFDGTETLAFTISSISINNGIVIGDKKEATLKFGAIVSEGQKLILEGKVGDVAYANSVYVDLSSNIQTPVDRKSWNLGFFGGSDFKVVLNGAYATTATASNKTDITAVTLADAEAAKDIAASPMTTEGLSTEVIDSFDGDLTKTVFAAISATDSENKVYFVASEGNKSSRDQWYKVKVSRNGEGYKVQYAKVSETTIKTVEIAKNAAYNFTFLSLETGTTVNVEPEAKKWDIVWGYNIGSTMGMPYFMQDLVLINNVAGTEAVQVMVSDIKYEDFDESKLTSLTFSKARNVIGSNWRVTSNMGGSTAPLGIQFDRYYVIKDANGFYYKLRFLTMGLANDKGDRGRPQIEYALIK